MSATDPTGNLNSSAPVAKPAWYRRKWVQLLAAAFMGLIIGATGSAADPKDSTEYKALKSQLTDTKSDLAETKSDLAEAEAEVGDLPQREARLKSAEAELTSSQQSLKSDEASVRKREKAVGIVEKKIEANTISGDGIYKVGTDIKAGTYKTKGNPGCYYAVLNSTDTFDIASNNNLDGPGFVTVRDGQYLEVTRCADWVLQ